MEEAATKTSVSTGNGWTSSSGPDSSLTKEAVVVLHKLPQSRVNGLRPPTPEQFYSEDDSLSSSDSDASECDSSDSDFSPSNQKTKEKMEKLMNITHASYSGRLAAGDPMLTDADQQLRQQHRQRRAAHAVPEVGTMVIALKKPLRWERGKVEEVVTKEDGRVKYKVRFEERGKILVSQHHVALDSHPRLAQLYVGARVVVRRQINRSRFCPGILAELPSRRNSQMFLIFLDDHTPVYVHLPKFRLVCKQLDNPLEDVPESAHRTFLEHYLKRWPHPCCAQYRVGEHFHAELKGAQKECQVLTVNASLVQVLFLENQFKEWIYRGSPRLEIMTRL